MGGELGAGRPVNLHPFADSHAAAVDVMRRGGKIFQQFLCGQCGTKQTMEHANRWYASGLCEECGHETNLREAGCNFMVVFGEPPEASS